MKECGATYKLSIRFENFYRLGDGGFHYPFGDPCLRGTKAELNDWYFKTILEPPNSSNGLRRIFLSFYGSGNSESINREGYFRKRLEPC